MLDIKHACTGERTSVSPDLFLGDDDGAVVQGVAQHVAAHALARLVVEVLKQRGEVLELQHRQDVVVGVHRDLQKTRQLLGHRTAGGDAMDSVGPDQFRLSQAGLIYVREQA